MRQVIGPITECRRPSQRTSLQIYQPTGAGLLVDCCGIAAELPVGNEAFAIMNTLILAVSLMIIRCQGLIQSKTGFQPLKPFTADISSACLRYCGGKYIRSRTRAYNQPRKPVVNHLKRVGKHTLSLLCSLLYLRACLG